MQSLYKNKQNSWLKMFQKREDTDGAYELSLLL